MENSERGRSPRPPDDIRVHPMASVLLRPPDSNRSTRRPSDGSPQNTVSRPSNESPDTSSATDIGLNSSIPQLP